MVEFATEHCPPPSAVDVEGVSERIREVKSGQATEPTSAGYSATLQVLPKALFMEALRHGRSQSNRSQAPLSMAILQLSENIASRRGELKSVRCLLRSGLRESDCVSFLRHRDIALLLPHTNEVAAHAVVDRIRRGNSDLIQSISIATYPDKLFETLGMSMENEQCSESALLADMPNSKPVQSVLKRGLDIFGASMALLLLSPLLLVIVTAIKLDSPGPAIFRQIRLGKDFKPFTFYKFRSMYADADDQVHRDYLASLVTGDVDADNPSSDGTKFYKIRGDSRVTPLGRFLRKTSIDELPQLVNVLRGEMSLVGPRPPIPYETENYQAWHLRRISAVKPGLTGLWQVEGRSKTTFDEMVRMDIRYSCNWSILLDLKLLLRTVKVVLECRGAV